ncbi:hypothetical protein [Furfurilactobacillus siliginis]|uniref:Uncharacterized protein n=1 Tax=Furfurilactobacillus siliginis TaxID=348151 RepID=A0A0R2LFE3_9LACO|nr:hypothetical protein [Furfurilactobacillus siliginis]KRN97309.1 hypothetical protein IV55_GL000237 [Furfurilactobacillus siliginis]GEK28621.1 hypothetical protein LSI01_09320 [Furfurilactobacillus siliginis]
MKKTFGWLLVALVLTGLLFASINSSKHPDKNKSAERLFLNTDKKIYHVSAGEDSARIHVTATTGATISMPNGEDENHKIKGSNGYIFDYPASDVTDKLTFVAKYKGQTKYIDVLVKPSASFISSDESKDNQYTTASSSSSTSFTDNASSATAPNHYSGSNNLVYGKLTTDVKSLPGGAFKDKSMTYVTYGVDKDKTIDVVKENFSDLPLDPQLDSDSIDEHIHDFMERDAAKISSPSDNQDIYLSPSINKKYQVDFTKNDDNNITMIIIRREDINE